ncbi:MAG: acylphosphatase [Spirochaetaceae bacterium]|nr:acylphosphatase [Spirochaetaceae bacterium]
MKAFHAIISGDVQGVGFRVSAAYKARSLGITGWVENRGDGSVEVWAEGDETDLEEFHRWLWQGPSMASVQDVTMTWEPPLGSYRSFGIGTWNY